MFRFEEVNVNQQANTLRIKLKSAYSWKFGQICEISSEFVLCGLVKLQIKNILNTKTSNSYDGIQSQTCLIKLAKLFKSDHLIYAIKLVWSSDPEKIFYIADDNYDGSNWQVFFESESRITDFDIKLSLDVFCNTLTGFPSLYDDTDLSNFELRGENGSISVHKAVLAHYSPVMKAMFSGQWKEVTAGALEIPKTSKETLQQLRDFMYLQKLPESGIENLAELACCYMMSHLEEVCTVKFLTSLTEENATKTLEIAVKYKMEKLMTAVMATFQRVHMIQNIINKFEAKLILGNQKSDESKE